MSSLDFFSLQNSLHFVLTKEFLPLCYPACKRKQKTYGKMLFSKLTFIFRFGVYSQVICKFQKYFSSWSLQYQGTEQFFWFSKMHFQHLPLKLSQNLGWKVSQCYKFDLLCNDLWKRRFNEEGNSGPLNLSNRLKDLREILPSFFLFILCHLIPMYLANLVIGACSCESGIRMKVRG